MMMVQEYNTSSKCFSWKCLLIYIPFPMMLTREYFRYAGDEMQSWYSLLTLPPVCLRIGSTPLFDDNQLRTCARRVRSATRKRKPLQYCTLGRGAKVGIISRESSRPVNYTVAPPGGGIFKRDQRERRSPLTEITLSSFPHLGKSQGSTQPKCNGRASPWRNHLHDHG